VPVRVTAWRGPQLTRTIRQTMARRLGQCGRLIHMYLVTTISTQGSYHPPFHSLPGDPPYRQTGDLIRSWQVELDAAGLRVRVSSDSEYVLALEFGASWLNLEPRPHGRAAFYAEVYHCAAILGAPL
jgi:hypothetical protein